MDELRAWPVAYTFADERKAAREAGGWIVVRLVLTANHGQYRLKGK